jgi:TetR/AcrR family fatty acid metabolism transcriptional regulator
MTEALDPIQELLIGARRNQILDAATKVFAEKGLHRATIKDIARAAGIADGTIYNYFANKDALLIGILDRVNQSQQRADHFAQAHTSDIAHFIRTYLGQRLARLSDTGLDVFRVLISELLVNPELCATYYQQVVEPTFAIADPHFTAWAAEGLIQTRDPRLANRAMAGMVLGVLLLRAFGDPYLQDHSDQVADVLADLLIHGLRVSQGDDRDSHQPTEPGESPV